MGQASIRIVTAEAGYNDWHDVNECVGYILTFSNGKSVYVTGDTSATEQMPKLAEKEIDYAFFCCDGVFNMGEMFDRELAEQFEVPNRMILYPGEELIVE